MRSDATTRLQSAGLTDFSAEDLLGQVPDVFGTVCVAALTGSIAIGFGNEASDIDVYVVIERDRIPPVPISSYIGGRRTDIRFFSSTEAATWPGVLDAPPLPTTRDSWMSWRSTMDSIVRFATGITLQLDPSWSSWSDSLTPDAVAERVERWWTLEAGRRYAAATLLQGTKPLGAAARMAEAVVALLDARAARSGEVYFGPKWLGLKLQRLGHDTDHLRQLSTVHATTGDAAERFAWAAQLAESLEPRLTAANLTVALEPNVGVEVERLLERPICHRWQLGSMPLDDVSPAATVDDLRWTGPLSEVPEPFRALFCGGMLWIAAW